MDAGTQVLRRRPAVEGWDIGPDDMDEGVSEPVTDAAIAERIRAPEADAAARGPLTWSLREVSNST